MAEEKRPKQNLPFVLGPFFKAKAFKCRFLVMVEPVRYNPRER